MWFAFNVREWLLDSAALDDADQARFLKLCCLVFTKGDSGTIKAAIPRLAVVLRIPEDSVQGALIRLSAAGLIEFDGESITVPMVADSETKAEKRREGDRNRKRIPPDSDGIQKSPADSPLNGSVPEWKGTETNAARCGCKDGFDEETKKCCKKCARGKERARNLAAARSVDEQNQTRKAAINEAAKTSPLRHYSPWDASK